MTILNLTAFSLAWCLLIIVAVAIFPSPVTSTPKVGQNARTHIPGLPSLPVPVERAAFEESQRGLRESDEDVIEHAFTTYEWVDVAHRQAVRVIMIDGESVEVELLEGQHAGRRCWLELRQLSF